MSEARAQGASPCRRPPRGDVQAASRWNAQCVSHDEQSGARGSKPRGRHHPLRLPGRGLTTPVHDLDGAPYRSILHSVTRSPPMRLASSRALGLMVLWKAPLGPANRANSMVTPCAPQSFAVHSPSTAWSQGFAVRATPPVSVRTRSTMSPASRERSLRFCEHAVPVDSRGLHPKPRLEHSLLERILRT